MRWVLTAEEMREADGYTIEQRGVPALLLMERAGKRLCEEAEKLAPTGRVLCVCGGGNNGGDGFVCARLLKNRGREVEVAFLGKRTGEACASRREEYEKAGGQVFDELPKGEYALVVDCLLGTGFHGAPSKEYALAIEAINAVRLAGAKVLSADIPSGVNGDNGRVESVAVQADETLCIGELKTGVLMGEGIDCAGEIVRADIGIVLPKDSYAYLIDGEIVRSALPARKRFSHKGTYGRAGIVAGSEKYTGAAYLAVSACLRSGAGYTTLYTPKAVLPHYILKSPEAILQPLCEGGELVFSKDAFSSLLSCDSIAYGMGTGVSKEVALGARYLLENYEGKLVLDADALHSLSAFENLDEVFARKKCAVLLTPHIKEFSRLSGESVQSVLDGGIRAPKAFAEKYGVTVLLKNAVSVVCDGARTALNCAGTSGQAKGGSGDVLAGLIAGLCAQGASAFESACAGAYLTGRSAELAKEKFGEYALTASDIISYLPVAFVEIFQKCAR